MVNNNNKHTLIQLRMRSESIKTHQDTIRYNQSIVLSSASKPSLGFNFLTFMIYNSGQHEGHLARPEHGLWKDIDGFHHSKGGTVP